MKLNPRSITIGTIPLAGIVWWFYPRETPRVWFIATAPNPEGLSAQRPTVEPIVDDENLIEVELKLDDQLITSDEISLTRNQKYKARGYFKLEHVPPTSTIVAAALSVGSKSENDLGMITESHTDLSFNPKLEKGNWRIDFDQEWQGQIMRVSSTCCWSFISVIKGCASHSVNSPLCAR